MRFLLVLTFYSLGFL
jgi:large subunit ribosomal protein L24e